MKSRGFTWSLSDRTRRGMTLSWLVLFVLSVLLQYGSLTNPKSVFAADGVDLDQWANKPVAAWQNGNLNGTNSLYAEGLVVPFRLAIEGLSERDD